MCLQETKKQVIIELYIVARYRRGSVVHRDALLSRAAHLIMRLATLPLSMDLPGDPTLLCSLMNRDLAE